MGISDLSFLSGLTELRNLDIRGNPVGDLSPLRELALVELNVSRTDVDDLSPLRGSALHSPIISDTGVSLDDLAALPLSRRLRKLFAERLGVADISALSEFSRLEVLGLGDNRVLDPSPLRGVTALRHLSLWGNFISDVSPLVENPGIGSGDWITLDGNPFEREGAAHRVSGACQDIGGCRTRVRRRIGPGSRPRSTASAGPRPPSRPRS